MVTTGHQKRGATFGVRAAGFVTFFFFLIDWLVVKRQSCAPGILCLVRSYHPPPGWGSSSVEELKDTVNAYFFE